MADETSELPKWRQFIKTYKGYLIAAFTAIMGILAGDMGILDALKSIFA